MSNFAFSSFYSTSPHLQVFATEQSHEGGQRMRSRIKMAAKIAASCGQFRAVKFPFRWLVLRTFCSGEAFENKGNTTSFFNPEIQSLLKKLTGRNLDKIYAVRKGELEVPSYKLMTDAEYLEVTLFSLVFLIYFRVVKSSRSDIYTSRHAYTGILRVQ